MSVPTSPDSSGQKWPLAVLRLLLAVGLGLLVLLILLQGVPLLLRLLPEDQPFLKAYLALVLADICVSLAFGCIGALTAQTLPLRDVGVRPQTGPWRLAVTLAIAGGLLVIPGALLTALWAAYQQGAFDVDMAQGRWEFGLLAAVYGGLAGTLLGFLLTRFRHVWRLTLGGLLGAGLCGALVGSLAGWVNQTELLSIAARPLVLLLVLMVHVGWSLGVRVALFRLAHLAAKHGEQLRAASAVQVTVVATLGLLTLAAVTGLTRTLANFVTTHAVDSTPLREGAVAPPVQCAAPNTPQERALWQVSVQDGRPDFSCGNAVLNLIKMPGGIAGQNTHSGFDDVATLVRTAKHEVLFTTMQWEEGDLNPGLTLTQALAELYAQVKAHPDAYPDGMQVKITLGNYPVVSVLEWGAQVWGALDDLRQSGVPLSDASARWRIELGNYDGTFPHSHVKLLVIDGQTLMMAGFNYGYMHYPLNHPSGKGGGLFDLGLVTRGPQAQMGVSIFDDLWVRSKMVQCKDQAAATGTGHQGCQLAGQGVVQHPAAAQHAVLAGTQRVYTFYRRSGFTQADDALAALYRASQHQIDLLHVNFSMDTTCLVAVLNPSLCTSAQQLPFMTALLEAMSRGVQVRLLTDHDGLSGIENRIALHYLRSEMARRKLPPERLQARFFPTDLHAKASLVDDQVLVIGSMNLHPSSWTQGYTGLNEAISATSDPATAARFRQMYDQFWAQGLPIK